MSTERTPRPAAGKNHPAVLRFVQFVEPADPTKAAQVVMSFELIEPDPETGMHISYFGGLGTEANPNGNAPIDFTVNALRNCGWTGDDLSELPSLAEADKLGEIVSLDIVHEEYKGKVSARIAWVNRPGGGGKIKLERVMDGAELKTFAQRMRTAIAAAGSHPTAGKKPAAALPAPRTQQRAAPPRGQQRSAPVIDDSDMPPFDDAPPHDDNDFLR